MVYDFCGLSKTNITIRKEAAKVSYVAGVYECTAEWSSGRQIFKNFDNGLSLFMRKDKTHWGVRASIDNNVKAYNYAKIVSGSAPDMCPTSPRTAITVRENRTHWAFGSGGKWKGSKDISVIAINQYIYYIYLYMYVQIKLQKENNE